MNYQNLTEIQVAEAVIECGKSVKAQKDEQRAVALKIWGKNTEEKSFSNSKFISEKSKTDVCVYIYIYICIYNFKLNLKRNIFK